MNDSAPTNPSNKSNVLEISVSELSGKLKKTVEDAFGYVRVRGEISGFRGPHSSGHCYFALKDERARLEAVIWRGVASKLKHMPEEGLEVIASGKLTTFPGSSKYQIVIDRLEPAGAGALMALLEERKKKLAAEGLFDEARKQLLPYMPKVVGVVTSPTGSVIRDVLHRLKDRFPLHVLVWPVRVQGETSGAEVATAIAGFNALSPHNAIPRPDLLIIARGGGSIEDLWGFNDEAVVRAAAKSDIPLISAIGHETDWTLLDLVADVRAPTPTGAAEMAVPVKADLTAHLANQDARLKSAILRLVETRRNDLRAAMRGLSTPDEILEIPRRRLDEATNRIGTGLQLNAKTKRGHFERIAGRLSVSNIMQRLERQNERVEAIALRQAQAFSRLAERQSDRLQQSGRMLATLSYKGTLSRGYAVIKSHDGLLLSTAGAVGGAGAIEIEMHDGKVTAHTGAEGATGQTSADTPLQNPLPPAKKAKRKQKQKPADDDSQGQLF